jgi:hypothetical protein
MKSKEGRLRAAFFYGKKVYRSGRFCSRGIHMRALLFCLLGLMTVPDLAFAQMKLSPKAAPTGNEVRYFTSMDGVMDGADVILKETRQGKIVTSATIDVCYPIDKGSARKDRFVANLAVNGQSMTGITQTVSQKSPVAIKLIRKPTGDTFEFKGQINVGQTVTEVGSSDNSDLSEKEFSDNQAVDDGINTAPKDFSEVSPEAIAVRIKLDAAVDFLKGLKGQDLEVSSNSLTLTCDALRSGEQTINMSADPERVAAVVAKFKSQPGVVAAGWTGGIVDMERAIRFSAAEWRDRDKINKAKVADTIARVLAKTLAAKLSSSAWSANTGALKLTFKRPSQLIPALDLTETVEMTALVAADKPGGFDRLMLWIGNPVISTADESSGAKLNLTEDSGGEEEGEAKDDNGSVEALAKEFKGQRWDSDKAAWK